MKKNGVLPALLCAITLAACPAPDGGADGGGNNKGGDTAAVIFRNDTQFYAAVHDSFFSGPVLLELAPGESKSVDVAVEETYGVGRTFCYTYRFNLSDSNANSDEAFAEGLDPNAQENFVLYAGETYTKQILVPGGIEFDAAFVRISNRTDGHFELRYLGEAYRQEGSGELSVAAGKSGVYKIPASRFIFSGYKVYSVFESYDVPGAQLYKGAVCDFVFTGEGGTPRVIKDTMWQIKPAPTSKWKKAVTAYSAAHFSDAALNGYLASVIRYSIADWRGNYPVNKLLFAAGKGAVGV